MKLALDKIRIDGGTQSRAKIDNKTVKEYAEAMKNGDKFPPVIVFYDEHDYWLADGFQRYEACLSNNFDKIDCKKINGTKRDAILYSVGANATHGQRRKNPDKHKAVITLLEDEEWREWSDKIIAEKCFVSVTLVYTIRCENPTYFSNKLTSTGLDGKTRKKKYNKKSKQENIDPEPIEETKENYDEEQEQIEEENTYESQEEPSSDQNEENNSEQEEEETENEDVDNNEEIKPKHKKKKTDYQLRREAAYDMIITFLESLPPKIQKREKNVMIKWLTNYPKELN